MFQVRIFTPPSIDLQYFLKGSSFVLRLFPDSGSVQGDLFLPSPVSLGILSPRSGDSHGSLQGSCAVLRLFQDSRTVGGHILSHDSCQGSAALLNISQEGQKTSTNLDDFYT